jgi:hypothetical protein
MAPTGGEFEMGGTITFPSHINIVNVYHTLADVEGSDSVWGLTGWDYSDSVRGVELNQGEVLVWNENMVWFDLSFGVAVDDFRIIIEYADPFPNASSFDIQLLTGEGMWREYSTGIRVGFPDGIVPGSGDFGETVSLTVPLTAGPPPAISGCIQIYGEGRQGLEVHLNQKPGFKDSAETDSNGCFQFQELLDPDEKFDIKVKCPEVEAP